MSYTVFYEKRAVKNLNKIDKSQQKMIVSWIEKHLVNTSNPRQFSKPLKGTYRIIAEINDNEVKIILFNIQPRKDIYK